MQASWHYQLQLELIAIDDGRRWKPGEENETRKAVNFV